MTPFEIVITAAIAIGFVAKLVAPIWDKNKHKIKNDILRDVVEGAVRAGEELEVSGQLGGKTKKQWVMDQVVKSYPEYKDKIEALDVLINAAVHKVGAGATAKKLAGKLPKKK